MKSGDLIRVSGRGVLDLIPPAARKGGEVTAKIVDRIADRIAMIEIGAAKLRAEFVRGLPSADVVTLRFEKFDGGSATFRMIDPAQRDAALRQILDLTLLGAADVRRRLPAGLSAALVPPPSGVFEFNARLLRLGPDRYAGRGTAELLNRLLRLGASPSTIADLAFILSGSFLTPRAAFLLAGGGKQDPHKRYHEDEARLLGRRIADDLAAVSSSEEGKECVSRCIELLFSLPDPASSERWGEFPWPHEGTYLPARLIAAEAGILVSVEFSAIGPVDILARLSDGIIAVTVFCDSADAAHALEQMKSELLTSLASLSAPSAVSFVVAREALQKIVEIYNRYCLNSVFDVRV